MKLAPYIACICEGSAESAIIDVLVDNNLLIFTREDMLEENVIRCRSAKTFEERFLRKGFKDQISVIRILDSRREEFRLSKAQWKPSVPDCLREDRLLIRSVHLRYQPEYPGSDG